MDLILILLVSLNIQKQIQIQIQIQININLNTNKAIKAILNGTYKFMDYSNLVFYNKNGNNINTYPEIDVKPCVLAISKASYYNLNTDSSLGLRDFIHFIKMVNFITLNE